MKIAHLISQFYPYLGGAEICVHNICNTLSANGHEAVVVTTTPPTAEPPKVNYQTLHLWSRTNGLFRRWPALASLYLRHAVAKLQKQHQFDLWQVTMGYPLGAYVVDYFNKNNIPCLLRCCGEDIQKFPEINYGYRLNPDIDKLTTAKYKLFDGHIALTKSVVAEYLEMGIPEEKINIIPNGVATQRFSSTPKTPLFQEKYGYPADTKVILTVGRHHPKKGYDRIPEIARRLKEKGLQFIWVIIGRDHEEFDQRFPEAKELGIHTTVNTPSPGEDAFSLPSQDLIQMYRAADIFAFPTLLETFGMVLVEAMAAELPILTTDAPGVCDVIQHEENGIKTGVDDIDDFTHQLEALLTDQEMHERYSKASQACAKNYDWQTITSQYFDLYSRTCGRN